MRIVRYSTSIIGQLDLDGVADALIMDADGNTSLSAPTDDQIDIEIGGADDFTFTANSFEVLTGSKIDLADSAQVRFGTGDDITMAWDGTDFDVLQATPDSSIKWGVDAAGIDQVWYGDTTAVDMTWDQSVDSLIFKDNAKLVLGTGSDVTIAWDGTDLDITCAADNSTITVGATGNSFDLVINGSTSSFLVTWDASANDLKLEDSVSLMFGTGGGAGVGSAGDVEIRWDGTDLDILAAADDSILKVGNGTNSFDVWVYGNTASDYLLWDAGTSKLTLVGAAMFDMGGTVGHLMHTPVMVTGDTSPDAAASGITYIVNGGAGTNFTLPAVATSAGLTYRFLNGVDQTMTVTAPANTMVVDNDVTATSIAFSTVGEKVGNAVEVFCDGSFWYTIVSIANDDVTATVV